MKTFIVKTALFAALAGVALSVGAKPAGMRSLESSAFSAEQQGITVALPGLAGRTYGGRRTAPISPVRPQTAT